MFGNQLFSKYAASFNSHSNTTFDSNSRIAQAILNHDKAEKSLSWKNADKVKLEIGMLYSEERVFKSTLAGRRKRFWTALLDLLKPHGWSRSGQHLIRGESRPDQ